MSAVNSIATKPVRAVKPAASDDPEKADDMTYDLANLYVYDRHPINTKPIADGTTTLEAVLKSRARDNVQLLFNRIFALPVTRIDSTGGAFAGAILADLPEETVLKIPREKPIPQPKPATKWELYKQSKGFSQRAKSSRMVYDEQLGEYRPRYGFRRANSDKDEWIMEHSKKIEEGSDPFIEKRIAKRQRVEKQHRHEIGNKKRAQSSTMRQMGLPGVVSITNEAHLDPIRKGTGPKGRVDKSDLSAAISYANRSTASIGKFDRKLAGQKKDRGTKRKYDPTIGDGSAEKSRSMKVFDRIAGKKDAVDMNRATNNQMRYEDSAARRGGRGGKRGGRGGMRGGKR